MRFFDTNYLFTNFGGTYTASSGNAIAYLAFNENQKLSWQTAGQGTDGTSISLERVLEAPNATNRIFVTNTNITDLSIQVDIGAGYVALSSASAFTLIKSNAGDSYFYELATTISISKIKFIGSNTLIANSEKTIQQCYAFNELGRIANNNDIQPKRTRIQAVARLNSGKYDIINKGREFSFKLKFKAHYNAIDNAIIDTVLQREQEMWLWINDDQEDSIVMMQEPYRFGDLYKVAFQKSDSVQFSKNAFFSGIDVDFNLVEVA